MTFKYGLGGRLDLGQKVAVFPRADKHPEANGNTMCIAVTRHHSLTLLRIPDTLCLDGRPVLYQSGDAYDR